MLIRGLAAAALLFAWTAGAPNADAGSESGNFMVRVLGTVVDPDSSAVVSNGAGVIAGANAEASTEVIPALTLSYFLNKNIY